MEHAVEVQNLTRGFGTTLALSDVSFHVGPGEFVTLLGPSGCGKTTTIRIVAGYLAQTSGSVLIDGRDVSRLPPQKREVGMVFQDYALFPHLSVRDNIGFGLKARRRPRKEIRARVEELLEMTSLRDAGDRKPKELSGGMQQRVAVARALAFEPRILLMDEPLAALDVKLREAMQLELMRLQREVGVTTVYVTHDQHEAMSMSDRIVIIDHGVVQQIGTPRDVYHAPASRFVAEFVGSTNLLAGQVVDRTDRHLMVEVGRERILCRAEPAALGATVLVVLRPEAIRVSSETSEDSSAQLPAVVVSSTFMGSWTRLTLAVEALGRVLVAQVGPRERWQPGAVAYVSWDPGAVAALEGLEESDQHSADVAGDDRHRGPGLSSNEEVEQSVNS